MNPPPLVHALLAADRIVQSKADGRCDLFGVFHALNLRLPTHLTFAVYFVLTGVHGGVEIDLAFLDPDDTRLGGGPIRAAIDDPLAVIQGTAGFYVPIDMPGRYRLRIESSGEVLAERPILIGSGT